MLTKIIHSIDRENTQKHFNAISFKIDLKIEIDENRHSNKNIDYKIKRQKAIKQQLGCKFIRIDPDKKDFDILELSMKCFDILNNQLKNINK